MYFKINVRGKSSRQIDGNATMDAMRVMQIKHFALLQVRRLLDEGRVSVHDTTEEGEPLLSLACSAGYYELAQV